MDNKKNLRIRISILYIVYFAALLGGVLCNTAPAFRRGAKLGSKVSTNMMESLDHDTLRKSQIYIDIPVLENRDIATLDLGDGQNTSLTMTSSKFNIIVSHDVDDDTSVLDLVFGSIGGSAMLYLNSLVIMALYIAIMVLTFLILHSLRRSVRDDLPLDKKCVWDTRAIGLILIIAEVLDAWGQWVMNKGAAQYLAGSDFTVDTSFALNYYTILLAILVIFTAEIFAIGSKLGEEQKLTI